MLLFNMDLALFLEDLPSWELVTKGSCYGLPVVGKDWVLHCAGKCAHACFTIWLELFPACLGLSFVS